MIACITTPAISIVLNGSPMKHLKMEKGLRYGDPMSPYLFILVSEILVFLFQKPERLGSISHIQLESNK